MGNHNNKIYLEKALKTAEQAGKLLLSRFNKSHKVDFKGRINLVTEMDRESEAFIVAEISKEFPDHGIIAEEGTREEGIAEYTWLIDPLDGTTNYAHGFGFFAVSLALMHKSEGIISGVVFAPYLDEMYSAQTGTGSYLNGERIYVSSETSIERSLLATGFPYDIRESGGNIREFTDFLKKAQAVRRPGSAAIDLCCVASGKFDGFWEMSLQPWDTAAGCLIVREAGGIVTDFAGNEFEPFCKKVLATNGKIHDNMMEILK